VLQYGLLRGRLLPVERALLRQQLLQLKSELLL
jgi:hypothetical protein